MPEENEKFTVYSLNILSQVWTVFLYILIKTPDINLTKNCYIFYRKDWVREKMSKGAE